MVLDEPPPGSSFWCTLGGYSEVSYPLASQQQILRRNWYWQFRRGRRGTGVFGGLQNRAARLKPG